jgi:AcrB/AcrD/AcrF family
VMTSIAMSAGMLPSALGVGEGGAFRAPMAIAVMGGIIVSTVLSLVVVPSMYLAMDDLSRFFAWILGRFIGKKDVEPVAPDPLVMADSLARNQVDVAVLQNRISVLEAALGRRDRKPHAAE